MIVNFFGKQFVKIQYGDLTIAYNPNNESKVKFGSDIVLSSMTHVDFHGIEATKHGDKSPFIVDGPGAYEISELPIIGVSSWTEYKGEKMLNTSYVLEVEGIRMVLLGLISEMDALDSESREKLGEADIVFVGLGCGLPPSKAYRLAKSFSPSYIVPLGEASQDDLVLKVFVDEAGQGATEPLDKWTVKPKDLIGKEAEIVVIAS